MAVLGQEPGTVPRSPGPKHGERRSLGDEAKQHGEAKAGRTQVPLQADQGCGVGQQLNPRNVVPLVQAPAPSNRASASSLPQPATLCVGLGHATRRLIVP